jgi:hypothetical protein
MSIPKLTNPLSKGIRTTEGILTTVVSSLVGLVSLVDPSSLPHREGAIIIAASTGLLTAQRGLIKVAAITQGLGAGAPATPTDVTDAADKFTKSSKSLVTKLDDGIHEIRTAELNLSPKTISLLEGFQSQLDALSERIEHPKQFMTLAKADVKADEPEVVDDAPELLADADHIVSDEEQAKIQPPDPEPVTKPESGRKPDAPTDLPAPAATPVVDPPAPVFIAPASTVAEAVDPTPAA